MLQNRMLSALHRTYEASPDEKINTAIEVAFAAASALIIALLVATALMEDAPPGYDAIVNFYAACESHAFPYNLGSPIQSRGSASRRWTSSGPRSAAAPSGQD